MEPQFSFRVYLCAALAACVFSAGSRAQNLPLAFEQNRKQADASVRFLTKTPAYQLHFKRNEVEITFKSQSLLIRFAGANEKAKPEGRGRLDDLIRYVHAPKSDNSRKVPTFAAVRYDELYPGIDLIFYGRRSEVRYDFLVEPESDPAQIRLVLENADHIEIDEDGGLVIQAGGEILRVQKPEAGQAGQAFSPLGPLDIRYKLVGSKEVSFELADYDRTLPLTIH